MIVAPVGTSLRNPCFSIRGGYKVRRQEDSRCRPMPTRGTIRFDTQIQTDCSLGAENAARSQVSSVASRTAMHWEVLQATQSCARLVVGCFHDRRAPRYGWYPAERTDRGRSDRCSAGSTSADGNGGHRHLGARGPYRLLVGAGLAFLVGVAALVAAVRSSRRRAILTMVGAMNLLVALYLSMVHRIVTPS